MLSNEIKIPVPWGHIAAKTWGNETDLTVLAVHGYFDNAGSFDALVPSLPTNFYYVCVDLPGHGLSSNFDERIPLQHHFFVTALKFVADHLGRPQYYVMGHSIGARFSCLFAQLYPEKVKKLILIDSTYTMPMKAAAYFLIAKIQQDLLLKSLTSREKKAYAYDEIIQKLIDGRDSGTLTRKAADQLACRMIEKVGEDRYEFTYDTRIRGIADLPFDTNYIRNLLEVRPLECEHLVLYMTTTMEHYRQRYGLGDYLKLFSSSKRYVVLEGHHQSHQTNPEIVTDAISDFLLEVC